MTQSKQLKAKQFRDREDAAIARRRQKYDKYREKELRLQRLYGISLLDLAVMVDNQKSRCAICEIETDRLEIDHNHKSGKVRGLLCGRCNRGIGLFDDDVEKLKAAILYLI